jgi:PAS domain S-box-containing protein
VDREGKPPPQKQAEERFQLAVEAAPNALVMVNDAGEIVLVNSETERLFGYRREELLGQSIEVLVPASSRESHPALRSAFFADPRARRMGAGRDLRAQGKDGSEFPVEIGLNPVETESGTWVLSSIVDITGRKRAEAAVAQALQQLQLIAENMAAGVTQCSRDLRYLWVSRAYASWMGMPSEEIVGHAILDVVGQKCYEDIRTHIEKVLSGEKEEYEAQVTFPGTGTRWIHAVYVPTKDGDHQVDGWIAVVTDVTDRHEAQERLRESEEHFRTVAIAAPVMIWASGPGRRFTFVNKGWLDFTGHTLEQELETGWTSSVHPEDLDRCLAVYSSSFDARHDFQMEYRMLRADGEYRWVLDHGIPLVTPGGVFQGYIGSCVDITDLKLAQKALLGKQKRESVGILAAGIAHDFNNLMGSIIADTDLALSEIDGGSPPLEEIQRIKTVALRASEIVRELMVYSGQDTTGFEPVEIAVLIRDMAELLKVSISKHAILQIDLESGLPAVKGHAAQIRQVLMNLIINASEAIGEKDGAITVTASRVAGGNDLVPSSGVELAQGDYVLIEVADTGCGMTEEQTSRMFDPFFSTKFAGRGLGLAVVQGVVRAHDGAISVVSAPGQGTTVQVFFPCWPRPEKQQNLDETAALPDGVTQATGTVLVVEDEGGLRIPVAKKLRKERSRYLKQPTGPPQSTFCSHTGTRSI